MSAKIKSDIMAVIGLIVAIIVVVALVPTQIEGFEAVSTSNWSVVSVAMWGLVVLGFVIALAMIFINKIGK